MWLDDTRFIRLDAKVVSSSIVFSKWKFTNKVAKEFGFLGDNINDRNKLFPQTTAIQLKASNELIVQIMSDPLCEYRYKAYKLFDKYIRVGSEYEINISSEMRQYLTNIFQNKQLWLCNINNEMKMNEIKLYNLFNNCIQEMMNLLHFSTLRLRSKKEFKRIANKIDSKELVLKIF